MIVPATHFFTVYQALKTDSNSSDDQSVYCFAACGDADSVCASQQLLSILNREGLHYSLIPVESYEEIRSHLETLKDAQEVKSVVLLNCGATEDVRSLCDLPTNIRIVIIDHHRPIWHGHNDPQDNDTLVLLDEDDPVPLQQIPVKDDELDQEVASDDEGSDGSDDEAEEGEDEEDGDEDGQDSDEGEEAGGAGTGGEGGNRKRRREPGGSPRQRRRRSPGEREAARQAERAERLQRRKERAQAVDAYYSERNGYGKPSSVLLYGLCNALQQDDFFHVWCAIVGLTEQLLFQQISKVHYNEWREALVKQVHNQAEHDVDAAQYEEAAAAGINLPRHKVAVEACEDLRLTLLRHWTIEESLRYTGYVAARLQTWRQKGLDNLRSLLTYMCIPLKHATTAFRGLREAYSSQLRLQLPRVAPKHMLAWEALHINSFRLLYKNEEVGASDMVFAMLGLLTEPALGDDGAAVAAAGGGPGAGGGGAGAGAAGRGGAAGAGGAAAAHLPAHRRAFNRAVDALHVQRNLGMVAHGIECAKRLCQDVVHECGLLITQGHVRGGKSAAYRWIDLAGSNLVLANARFSHPTVLRYMALFLRDATSHRYASGDARRPMVVAGPPDEAGNCCVVAVAAKQISGKKLQNNPFAKPFIETLSALNIAPSRSAFDNATYHMRKDQVLAFLNKLQDVVAEYTTAAEVQQAAAAAL